MLFRSPVEVPTAPLQDAGQGESAEASQGNAPDAAPLQSKQVADHQDPRTRPRIFMLMFSFCFLCLLF